MRCRCRGTKKRQEARSFNEYSVSCRQIWLLQRRPAIGSEKEVSWGDGGRVRIEENLSRPIRTERLDGILNARERFGAHPAAVPGRGGYGHSSPRCVVADGCTAGPDRKPSAISVDVQCSRCAAVQDND